MQPHHSPKLYSYVVDHDNGQAPNPYFSTCTLCLCKFRGPLGKRRNVVELAAKKDWVIGTGGANLRKSAGRGKLIYAMRVDQKLTRQQYFDQSGFTRKKPVGMGTYEQTRGDNKRPRNAFEKHHQFALISRHFYYFGRNAIVIPERFDLEKKGRGFRSHFEQDDIRKFVEWLERNPKSGRQGEPCYRAVDKPKGRRKCKSSC